MLLVIQIACFLAKKVWVRLLPILTVVALMALCVVMYAISGWTNWAYLILLGLLFGVLVFLGMEWLVFGVIHLLGKIMKKQQV